MFKFISLTSDIFLCQFRNAGVWMGLSGQRTADVGCIGDRWPHQRRILDQTRLQITHISSQRGNPLMAAMKLDRGSAITAATTASGAAAATTNSGTAASPKIDGSSGHTVKEAGGVITHRTVP